MDSLLYLAHNSDMMHFQSVEDHDRFHSYVPGNDPGKDGNPDVTGVDLCSNCRTLRWLGLPRPPKAERVQGKLPFRYQDSTRTPVSSTCELCQAICATLPSTTQVMYITLSLGRLADAIAVEILWPDQTRPYDLLFIEVEDDTGRMILPETAYCLRLCPQTEGVTVQQIQPESVDYTEVRLWVDHCDSTHFERCHTTTKHEVPGFKVIDCLNRNLVSLPDLHTQYVALSYVWGTPIPEVDNSERFPQTIEDSINVTSKLGYRYLWVDRYVSNTSTHQLRKAKLTGAVHRPRRQREQAHSDQHDGPYIFSSLPDDRGCHGQRL
jgi:hypothetical protein